MKKQIVIIHGGDTYDTYEEYLEELKNATIEDLSSLSKKGWKDRLQENLGDTYDVITPKMPNKGNAKYLEWKIWFEKIIPLLNDDIILIGYSLGGIFLAQYLSENIFPKTIRGVFLVAAPHDDASSPYSLADFVLPQNLDLFQTQSNTITLYHSKDDYVVPFKDLERYKEKLPQARSVIFEDKGHFNQETFSELVSDILQLDTI